MGNKICGISHRQLDDRLTRPQRITRQPSDVDYKKLRKLILSKKLAPCFDAVDDSEQLGDLEECPICFLYYPCLNRARCCGKGICTECFLQMKPSHTGRPVQCPFCKTSCYAVEYRGARTEEEKDLERAEEQKVIEAKLRIQYESRIEEQVMHLKRPKSLWEALHDDEGPFSGHSEGAIAEIGGSVVQESIEDDSSSNQNICSTRHEEFNLDLDEMMVMQAIWQSLQDSRLLRSDSSESGSESETTATLQSCDQGENSSCEGAAGAAFTTLTEHNIMQQQITETDFVTRQTDLNPYEKFVRESNSMRSNSGCSIVIQAPILATELNA